MPELQDYLNMNFGRDTSLYFSKRESQQNHFKPLEMRIA
jgi:hypothetical protein